VNPESWPLGNLFGQKEISAFFSEAGYKGSGNLYFGSSDGFITTSFRENPLKLKLINSVVINEGLSDGGIAVTGNIMVTTRVPNEIQVFLINPDGSLTALSETIVPGRTVDVFSISLFPNTR
jgi:hypothetical protein